MPYNDLLERKIDAAVEGWRNVEKKKMFGGICYLLRGNMCFGVWKDFLIVRMSREEAEQSLKLRNVGPFDITGRPMAGWVMVQEPGWKGAAGLAKWLNIGKTFARTLPEKRKKAGKKTKNLREYGAR